MSDKPRLTEQLGFVRMASTPEVRTEANGRKILRGTFAPFNQWTLINSWEGKFRERSVPGAFKRTISQSWDTFRRVGRHSIVVNYNHGFDPQVGGKQLGQIRVLEEREEGPYYEVALLDTEYNRDYIVPAAEDGLLGASFRFAVPKEGDVWEHDTEDGIPERSLVDVAVFEFGPVDHPAYEAATAGVRSATEFEWWRNLDEEGRAQYAALIRKAHDLGTSTPVEPAAAHDEGSAEERGTPESEPDSPPAEAPVGRNRKQRRYLADKAIERLNAA